MIITSLRLLQENKKRKDRVSVQGGIKKSTIKIPGTKFQQSKVKVAESGKNLQFDKLYVPDGFLSGYKTNKRVDNNSAKSSDIDWWLDENGYSNELGKRSKIQPGEDKFTSSLQPQKRAIPGTVEYPHHHHTQDEFSCDPDVPHMYKEVLDADQLALRRSRPKWEAPKKPITYNVSSPEPQSDVLDKTVHDDNISEVTSSNSSVSSDAMAFHGGRKLTDNEMKKRQSKLKVSGTPLDIQPLSIASGSAAIGLGWTPAPPKMSLPLKLYLHAHSLPSTPRAQSRQVCNRTLYICIN